MASNANQVPKGTPKKSGGVSGAKMPKAGPAMKPTSKAEMASAQRKAELTRFGKQMKPNKGC